MKNRLSRISTSRDYYRNPEVKEFRGHNTSNIIYVNIRKEDNKTEYS